MSTPTPANGSSASMNWEKLYERAVFERDCRKLIERIAEARSAIYDRVEAILNDSSSCERSALNSALRTLRLLEEIATKQPAA